MGESPENEIYSRFDTDGEKSIFERRNIMKKNKMMRVAAVLLVMVILTMSIVSGTFAKYITQDNGSDSARVAKWGVELQVVGNLYGDSYDDLIVLKTADSVAVQAVDFATAASDVVAPGTKNEEGFRFSLNGKPEVDGIVTSEMKIQNIFLKAGKYGVMIPVDNGVVTEANYREFEDLYVKEGDSYVASTEWANVTYYTLEDYVDNTDDYYPVVYNLAGPTSNVSDFDEDSLKIAADKIATQLGLTAGAADADTSVTYTGQKPFETNTDLAGWKLGNEKLTWKWNFENTEKDGADTILGLLEKTTNGEVVKLEGTSYVAPVEYEDYCLETQFSLNITVEQVD